MRTAPTPQTVLTTTPYTSLVLGTAECARLHLHIHTEQAFPKVHASYFCTFPHFLGPDQTIRNRLLSLPLALDMYPNFILLLLRPRWKKYERTRNENPAAREPPFLPQ